MTALMILIIATLAGIYIIAKGRISFSGKKEIVRPKSTIIGIALIILSFLSFFLNIFAVIGIFILIIIFSFFLSQKKIETLETKKGNTSATNLLILIIFAALIAFAFWYFTKI